MIQVDIQVNPQGGMLLNFLHVKVIAKVFAKVAEEQKKIERATTTSSVEQVVGQNFFFLLYRIFVPYIIHAGILSLTLYYNPTCGVANSFFQLPLPNKAKPTY